jgi:hypothetical protein
MVHHDGLKRSEGARGGGRPFFPGEKPGSGAADPEPSINPASARRPRNPGAQMAMQQKFIS